MYSLIDEGATRLARVTKDTRLGLILVDILIASRHFDLVVSKYGKLHGRSSKLATLFTMTPYGELWIPGYLSCEGTTN
jgi:hypothetical protein